MTEGVYATVSGVELVLCRVDDWRRKKEGYQDLWMPCGQWDGPTDPRAGGLQTGWNILNPYG